VYSLWNEAVRIVVIALGKKLSWSSAKAMGESTMKKPQSLIGLCIFLALILGLGIAPPTMIAADPSPIIGNWEGTLDPGARPKKRIVVHITEAQDGILSGTIDYPDESVSGLLITAINYKEPALHFESSSGQVSYDGTMNKQNSEIAGTWKQGAAPLRLTLTKTP
jgi:hypothetical protein